MGITNAFFDLREQPEMMAFDQSYIQRLTAMNPLLAEYKQAIDGFGSRVKKHPVDYLLWLDTLPSGQRQLFFDFMNTVGGSHMAFETEWLNLDEPFKLALQKPELIGAYGTSIDLGAEDYIVVSFVDDSTIPIPDNIGHANSDRHVEGGKESLPVDDRNTMHAAEVIPKNFISARFMIELIQKFNPSRKYPVAILTQWTPTFSHAFVSLNEDGKYDEFFLELYPIISRYRQKHVPSTKLVANPLYSADSRSPYQDEMERMAKMSGGDDDDMLMMHEMMGDRYAPEKVPEDLVPILNAIKKRQEQKKAAEVQAAPSPQ